jgi:hypothetical protein
VTSTIPAIILTARLVPPGHGTPVPPPHASHPEGRQNERQHDCEEQAGPQEQAGPAL